VLKTSNSYSGSIWDSNGYRTATIVFRNAMPCSPTPTPRRNLLLSFAVYFLTIYSDREIELNSVPRAEVLKVLQLINTQVLTNQPTGIAQSYGDGLRAGRHGFDSRKEKVISLFSTASRPALGPTQPLIQCLPEALSPG
jgi:hypothetical protein